MTAFDDAELATLQGKEATAGDRMGWVRFTELEGGVLHGTAHNVTQGILDDCWVMAALVTVATARPALQRRIVTHNAAKGTCTVRIWKRGKPHDVTVTDTLLCKLPTDPTGPPPCPYYARSPGAWWIAIAEKAYAALHTSYAALAGGLEADALMDFTGWPAHIAPLTPSLLQEALQGGDLIGLSMFGDSAETAKPQVIRATVGLPGKPGETAELHFTVEADAASVVRDFVEKHGLQDTSVAPLTKFVLHHQKEAAAHAARAGTAEGAHASRPETAEKIVESHSYAVLGADTAAGKIHLWNAWGAGALKGAEVRSEDLKGSFWLAMDALPSLFNAVHHCVEAALVVGCELEGGEGSVCAGEGVEDAVCAVMAPEPRAEGGRNAFATLGFTLAAGGGRVASPLCPVRQLWVRAGAPLESGSHAVALTHPSPAEAGVGYTALLFRRVPAGHL